VQQGGPVPHLVTITGPLAAGKSTVARLLAERCSRVWAVVVLVDVDEVAAMVAGPGVGPLEQWPAAHLAHGALVAGWLRAGVDVVVSDGPGFEPAEHRALDSQLPAGVRPLRVLLDAPVSATWPRAVADPTRGASREHGFHHRLHARYRELVDQVPADLRFDTGRTGAEEVAAAVLAALRDRADPPPG
jgi:thymidylate kinase